MPWLVDTSVWIDFFVDNKPEALRQRIDQDQVLLHPLVEGELRAGTYANREVVLFTLNSLPTLSLCLGSTFKLMETHAMYKHRKLSFIDMALCAAALSDQNLGLWTHDKRLMQLARYLKVPLFPTT